MAKPSPSADVHTTRGSNFVLACVGRSSRQGGRKPLRGGLSFKRQAARPLSLLDLSEDGGEGTGAGKHANKLSGKADERARQMQRIGGRSAKALPAARVLTPRANNPRRRDNRIKIRRQLRGRWCRAQRRRGCQGQVEASKTA